MRLENKVAIITGGGSGIGAAAARLFAREGAKIVITGRRPEPIAAVAAEVGGVAVAGDTGDPGNAAEAVAVAVSAFGGGIDVVVTSAGGGVEGSVGDIDDEGWRRTFDTNLNGPTMLVRAALPVMLESGGGSIVLVASVNGICGCPGLRRIRRLEGRPDRSGPRDRGRLRARAGSAPTRCVRAG